MRTILLTGFLLATLLTVSGRAHACTNVGPNKVACTVETSPADTGTFSWVMQTSASSCVDGVGGPGVDLTLTFGSFSYTDPSGSTTPLSGTMVWKGPAYGQWQGGTCGPLSGPVYKGWGIPAGTLTFEYDQNPLILSATIN
jgi:hypothetical protein